MNGHRGRLMFSVQRKLVPEVSAWWERIRHDYVVVVGEYIEVESKYVCGVYDSLCGFLCTAGHGVERNTCVL
jgi:hypothetical protein